MLILAFEINSYCVVSCKVISRTFLRIHVYCEFHLCILLNVAMKRDEKYPLLNKTQFFKRKNDFCHFNSTDYLDDVRAAFRSTFCTSHSAKNSFPIPISIFGQKQLATQYYVLVKKPILNIKNREVRLICFFLKNPITSQKMICMS